MDSPSDRLDWIDLIPETSDSMTFEIDQTAALSFEVEIDLPVEISSWVFDRLPLMFFRVCRAVRALVFVRMLDISSCPSKIRRFCAGVS